MMKLHDLATKELAATEFNESDLTFIQKAITQKLSNVCGTPPDFTGWYCSLFYVPGGHWTPDIPNESATIYEAEIADVHTDPNSKMVLEVATGRVQYGVFVIDNEDDLCVYVGPLYSYYEFLQPAGQRLQDEEWNSMVLMFEEPDRPKWTHIFRGEIQESN